MRLSSADHSNQVPERQGGESVFFYRGHKTAQPSDTAERGSGWTLAADGHRLGTLQGETIGPYRLVIMLGTTNRFGARYFRVFLQDSSGELGRQPVLTGLHSQGKYPGYNWIEVISISTEINFGEEVMSIALGGLIQQLFKCLAGILPPGGHMMVEYDSAEQQDTARSLALGIPPVATPLGTVLLLAGCGSGFKDWYFAEGGAEGPRKLQGYKALDNQHARLRTAETVKELRTFLAHWPEAADSVLELAARKRASDILNGIKWMAHEEQ